MRTPMFLSLLFATCVAHAMSVDLAGATYGVATFAELGTAIDGIHADSSPPTDLPLASGANVIGSDAADGEFATADAVADDGFLAIDTEVLGLSQPAAAVARASLATSLSGAGHYTLHLDFETASELDGGHAQALLGLALNVGGHNVFDELFSSSDAIERGFDLAPGEEGLLNITLSGAALGFAGDPAGSGYGFSLSSVGIELEVAPVPDPSAWLLMLTGVLPLARLARRKVAQCPGVDAS